MWFIPYGVGPVLVTVSVNRPRYFVLPPDAVRSISFGPVTCRSAGIGSGEADVVVGVGETYVAAVDVGDAGGIEDGVTGTTDGTMAGSDDPAGAEGVGDEPMP